MILKDNVDPIVFKPGDWVKDKHGYQLVFEFDCLGKACCRSICGNYYLKDYSEIFDDDNENRKKIVAAEIRRAKRQLKKIIKDLKNAN